MASMLTALVLLQASTVTAGACGEERNVRAGALDEMSWRRLSAIYEDVGEGRYEAAAEDLQRMLAGSGRDSYLLAVVRQALGQVEWSRGRYGEALGHLEQAVASDALPDRQHFALVYQVAQLYFRQGRDEEALEWLALWFCGAPEEARSPHAWAFKAAIHARRPDFAGALEAIDAAIGSVEGTEAKPQESWLQLKAVAHAELGQHAQAADTLETLVARWPDKRDYWLRLTQARLLLQQDGRALAVLALAHRRGLLVESADIDWLAGLYLVSDLPYKAAEALESGIGSGIVASDQGHWTRIAEAWYAAEELERALLAYQTAGEVAENGISDLRRAYLLVELERWPAALDALVSALDKGGLDERSRGEAYLLRGLVRFNLGRLDLAGEDWRRAVELEATREAAGQWLRFLRDERRRRAS
jgi:tetratricopeptide (TPR) repeat protein